MKKIKPIKIDQSVEALRDIGSGIKKSFEDDVAKGMISDLWKQMLGETRMEARSEKKGDLKEGEELDLTKSKKTESQEKLENKREIAPAIDYTREILYGEKRLENQERSELSNKIQEILVEIKQLTNSSEELSVEFKEVTVNQMPINPGKYHLNFFEWMLGVIRGARIKVENSANWLSTFSNKKDKKTYWNLSKKHGTSFMLSGERTPATQTG